MLFIHLLCREINNSFFIFCSGIPDDEEDENYNRVPDTAEMKDSDGDGELLLTSITAIPTFNTQTLSML